MSKKSKLDKIDFDTGIDAIIPSTQQAYHDDLFSGAVRHEEKQKLSLFKQLLGQKIDQELKVSEQFPSSKEFFVFIVQYFSTETEYLRRDIDNMAKTILDVLKGRFYRDDSQVKTLLVGKKMERRVPQNFAYVAIKELSSDRDIDALKISGIERSVTLFQKLKSKGLLL